MLLLQLKYYNLHSKIYADFTKKGEYIHGTMKITNKTHIQINLLFQVGSTCFGRWFRPSSGALDCIYSIWWSSPKLLLAGSRQQLG